MRYPRSCCGVFWIYISGWFWIVRCLLLASPVHGVPGETAEFDSVAVLALENGSGDPAEDYFAAGMTDSILVELSELSSLKVISGTSLEGSLRAGKTVSAVAEELGADVIVEGSVIRAGEEVQLSLRLVDGRTGKEIWTQDYVRKLKEVWILHTEAAKRIASTAERTISAADERHRAKTGTVDPDAYLLYLQGNARQERGAYLKAITLYEESAGRAPHYAPAFAALSLAYCQLAGGHSPAAPAPHTLYLPAKQAVSRALKLDPELGEAHLALGRVREVFEWDWSGAEESFRRSLDLNPRWRTYAFAFLAGHLMAIGRFEEAVEVARKGLELDPLSLIAHVQLGLALDFAGQTDLAREHYRKGGNLDIPLAFHYARRGDLEKALDHIERVRARLGDSVPDWAGFFGYVFAKAGRRKEALAVLGKLKDRRRQEYVSANALAFVYLGLGQNGEAMVWLERACAERNPVLMWLKSHWLYDSLRDDPRFQDLVRRMEFP